MLHHRLKFVSTLWTVAAHKSTKTGSCGSANVTWNEQFHKPSMNQVQLTANLVM